jgi:hypothetical protein
MWWGPVPITDAKKGVTINGSVAAALRAHRGVTVGCALSETARESAKQFGHPVFHVSVTKSTLLVVDRQKKNGEPAHAIRYGHGYGRIVDSNDDGSLKKLVKDNPELMERPFHLRAPRKRPSGKHPTQSQRAASAASTARGRRSISHRGALARAVKAGGIGEHVAQQLAGIARQKKSESETPPTAPAAA